MAEIQTIKTILMGFVVLQTPLINLRMIVLLLLMTLFASCSSTPPPSRYNFTIAKPNCVDRCGNISIPFPFGTTPECYLNRTFWLTCNQSGFDHPKLFWQDTSIELTDVSLDGQIKILHRVVHDCYGPTGNRTSYSGLTGIELPQHFRVNTTANRLTIVGCATLGVASIVRPYTGIYRLGCIATCNGEEDLVNGSCYGIGCCQIPIPKFVWDFSIELQRFGDYSPFRGFRKCSHAFLAEKTAFNFSSESRTTLMNVIRLPMVADWIIEAGTCDEAMMNSLTYACKSQNSICTTFDWVSRGYRCGCQEGFEGNPYVDGGCQDIDECQRKRCRPNSVCVNTIGGYKCLCPRGYYGDGRIGSFGCHRLPSKRITLWRIWTGLGVGIGSVLFLLLCFWFHKIIKKRADKKRKEKFFKRNGGILLQQQQQQQTNEGTLWQTKHFQAKELEQATDNFNESRILGQGGQGTVYKGMLSNGQIVAIKKSKQVDEDQVEQFINEVVILSKINHRNVVKLLGCCLEDEVPLLVYEFVPNGTLFNLINDPNNEFPVSWNMRLKIAADIAGALAYLHSACSLPIYHRDIKSSNILLDEKYVVKVSDFGTSKSVTVNQTHVTTLVKGTFGYLDPEYFQSGQFTEKSDVYSFGVVLVELLTGQRAISMNRTQEEKSLATRFLILMERGCLDEILDDQVLEQGKKEEVALVARLSQRCLNLQGRMRPTMKEVATELESVRMSQMPPAASSADNVFQEAKFDEPKMMMISDFEYSWTTGGKSVASSSLDSHPLMFETISTPSGDNFPIAKPNCTNRCGNISIPYPFGYLSLSFWLTCNRSGLDHPKLFWQNTSIELTDVSLDGQIKILLEIVHDCYDNLGNRTWYSGDREMELPAQFTVGL